MSTNADPLTDDAANNSEEFPEPDWVDDPVSADPTIIEPPPPWGRSASLTQTSPFSEHVLGVLETDDRDANITKFTKITWTHDDTFSPIMVKNKIPLTQPLPVIGYLETVSTHPHKVHFVKHGWTTQPLSAETPETNNCRAKLTRRVEMHEKLLANFDKKAAAVRENGRRGAALVVLALSFIGADICRVDMWTNEYVRVAATMLSVVAIAAYFFANVAESVLRAEILAGITRLLVTLGRTAIYECYRNESDGVVAKVMFDAADRQVQAYVRRDAQRV